MSARAQTGAILSLVAGISAAMEDADPGQKADLQRGLVPKLRKLGASKDVRFIKDCHEELLRIMGPGWQPRGQWASAWQDPNTIITEGIADRGYQPDEIFAPPA